MSIKKESEINDSEPLEVLKVGEFIEDERLDPGELLITIKNLDGKALRAALEQSGVSGRSWGRDIRKDTRSERGALAVVSFYGNEPSCDIVSENLYGPRGILSYRDTYYIATSENISIYDRGFEKVGLIEDKFASWMHALTVHKIEGEEIILGSSSRLGTIIGLDPNTNKVLGYWHGWEHGLNMSVDGSIVTADIDYANELREGGIYVTVIDKNDPQLSLDQLTTPKQAFRCTGMVSVDNSLVATLFTGEVVRIPNFRFGQNGSEPSVLVAGYTNLHSPEISNVGGIEALWFADTMKGKVVGIDGSGLEKGVIDFSGQLQENMDKRLGGGKIWLQGFKMIGGLMVALDGTANQIMIADITNRKKRVVSLPSADWAVHDFNPLI